MKKSVLLFCLIFMLSEPAATFGFGIEFSLDTWYEQPSGTLSYDKTSSADDLSLENDLNYNNKWQPTGRLKIDMPSVIPNIYIMYTPMKWDETGSKNSNFSFGDETFQANVDFDSELKRMLMLMPNFEGPLLKLALTFNRLIRLILPIQFILGRHSHLEMSAPVFVILERIILSKMGTPTFSPAQGSLQNKFGHLRGKPQFKVSLHLTGGFRCDEQGSCLGFERINRT